MSMNAALAPFDLDECADRRFVNRDGDILVRELLAIFLVPEPHAEAELFEHAQQDHAIADHRFHLLAELHG